VSVTGEGATVQVAVRDHGPGLPDGAGEAVFDRFWRSEGGRSRGRGGAGLGLAIVRAIVTAQHGEVRAADAPGGGARFTVSLGGATPHSANPQPALTERIQPSATVR
jgi:two-component system OmpR family sensor kinase